ncbi:hypothetical protein BDR03DRAFT_933868 [Suillus americanus]|nr:hypothetical protein BDR03DRAFT_933868 [Suillus americanus]
MQRQAAAQLRRLTEENTARVAALRKQADSSAGEVSRLRAELVQTCKKGAYTAKFHALARRLILAGCAQKSVGPIIQAMLKAFHIPLGSCCMSAWTVQRAILEGGIAAKVQLGHEIMQTKSLTFSSDSMTHRHINMNSWNVSYKAPTYSNLNESMPEQHNWFLGIESSKDRTSMTQLQGLKTAIDKMASIYNYSPLAQRTTTSKLTAVIFTSKLKGINGDHSADQKKAFELIQRWKNDNWRGELGMQAILRNMEISGPLAMGFAHLQRSLVEQHGGLNMWNALSLHEHDAHKLLLKQDLAEKVGNRIVGGLPDDEWRAAKFLVQAGCCMHKDIHSVKGRNMVMMDSWELNGFKCPMLLANKNNTTTLQQPSEAVTEVQLRALEVSGRGGIKTCSLAGAIFNNKDNKKGQQDMHCFYFEQIKGILSTFPDTSNTCYQLYCEAAVELLTYLNEYITFLEQVRDKKEKQNFSHIKKNLYNALHDGPTLTELTVLTLYAAAITPIYNVNILDLGPLHDEVMNHFKLIIENLHLLISLNVSFKLSALDGQEWQNPGAIEAVHKLAEESKLPHLCEAFVTFCGGALETWERFLIEFKARAERDSAFMASTNDANEGVLGSYWLHARQKPRTLMHSHNIQAQLKQNETQAFIDATFAAVDQSQYTMQKARKWQSAGLEEVVVKIQRRTECAEKEAAEDA